DLAREQQRRYDAEAERNLMNIAYNNEAKERRRYRLSSYLAGTGIDPVANQDQAFAGMGALWGRTMAQMNTSNSFRNPSIAHDYANVVGNNAVTVGLSPDLEDDAEYIGTEQPLADLFEILEHIEIRRAEKKLGLVSKIPQSSYKSSSKLISAQESRTQHFVLSQSVSSQSVS
ncbi:39622_t:CDS:2, partial [Gigaspora margarita]